MSKEVRRKHKIIVYGGAYTGKTTAHRNGLGVDVESSDPYAAINYCWGKVEMANDPEWKKLQMKSYEALCLLMIDAGVTPLLIHWNARVHEMARSKGYDERAVFLTDDELSKRRDKTLREFSNPPWLKERDKAVREWVKKRDEISRLRIPIYPTVKEAIEGSGEVVSTFGSSIDKEDIYSQKEEVHNEV